MDGKSEFPTDATTSSNGRATPQPGEPVADPVMPSRDACACDCDYQDQSLFLEDPLEANLNATNADLMGLAHMMQQAITRAVAPETVTPAQIAELAPVVDQYLRLLRQTDRFSQLALRVAPNRGGPGPRQPSATAADARRYRKIQGSIPTLAGG